MRKLIIIDLSNYIYRAYYATSPLTAPDGTQVNAVYGVLGMVNNLVNKYKPTHVLVARDSSSADSVRKTLYPEYKSNRSSMPDNLGPQFHLVNEMIEALEMTQVRVSGYEADDVIGSAATQFKGDFDEILIATGDKDILQFVGDQTQVVDTLKGITYGREEVFKKMGVYPEHIVDYLSIVGDKSDNIPGVEGIGPKGAIELIQEFGHVDDILARANLIGRRATRDRVVAQSDRLTLSKNLATIVCSLDLGVQPDQLAYKLHSTPELEAFFDRLNFKSWKGRL